MGFNIYYNNKELEISLFDNFSVYDVTAAKNEIIKFIDDSDTVIVRSDNLTKADTSGVQLLISLFKTCQKKNINIILPKNSGLFREDNQPASSLKSYLCEREKSNE